MVEKGEKLDIIAARAMLIEFLYELIKAENGQTVDFGYELIRLRKK